ASDIGYSRVKIATSPLDGNPPELHNFISAAAQYNAAEFELAGLTARRIFHVHPKGALNPNGYLVGDDVRSFLRPQDYSRAIDQRFLDSDTYRALFYGSLAHMVDRGAPSVMDLLVLGVPVRAWQDQQRKRLAVDYARGVHRLPNHRSVEVRDVIVLPQPYGAYADVSDEALSRKSVLIIDGGEFTTDWLFIEPGGRIHPGRSGSVSDRGRYNYLQAILTSLSGEAGKELPERLLYDLDMCLRASEGQPDEDPILKVGGRQYNLREHLPRGQEKINDVIRKIVNAVGGVVDVETVVLAGGNPRVYERAIQQGGLFDDLTDIVIPPESIYSNVRGFHTFGEQTLASKLAA
ncbi:MAG: hypothetical protein KGQ77_03645, partial [Betaproteobacteria bacterium]|nr:hypothetical protein [Betaproteobacteria bacterium]